MAAYLVPRLEWQLGGECHLRKDCPRDAQHYPNLVSWFKAYAVDGENPNGYIWELDNVHGTLGCDNMFGAGNEEACMYRDYGEPVHKHAPIHTRAPAGPWPPRAADPPPASVCCRVQRPPARLYVCVLSAGNVF